MVNMGSRKMNQRKNGPGRTTNVKIVLAMAILMVMGGFTSALGADDTDTIKSASWDPRPIRAQIGGDIVAGFKVYLDEVGNKIAGKKVELIIEDSGSPTTSIAKARKLITHDNVDIMAGLFSSSNAYAVAPLAAEANLPLVITGSAGDDLTQRKRSPSLIRVNVCGSQAGHTAADYAYNQLGWRTVSIIGWEHAFGQETLGAFHKAFEDAAAKWYKEPISPGTPWISVLTWPI